jgi:outer membrane protein insertion porin family
LIGEVSVADRNLMGRGNYAKASVSYGQYVRGFDLTFVEPFLFGYRMAGGIDLFARQNFRSSYVSYDSQTVGTNLRLGFALTEEIAFQPRYSFYQQKITLPNQYNNCQFSSNALINGGLGVTPANEANGSDTNVLANGPFGGCYADGEASLAIRKELAAGPVNVSLVGYTMSYNTLDNNKLPTSGLFAELRQDFAGVGGDVDFIRTSVETRKYYEVFSDVVSVFKLQAGNISSWGGQQLRMLDHFQMGPNLVRGFSPAGIGPRDLTPGTTNDALGGSLYWGASVEAQTPLYFLPKDVGIKLAVFADAGSLWSYKGPTFWNVTGETLQVGLDSPSMVRSSVGVGLLWDSPLGPLRFDLAYPITKYCATPVGGGEVCDRTQVFRFSGGTRF